MGASHLLPIFDDVNLKAVFTVSVIHSRAARALSNMPLRISANTCVTYDHDRVNLMPDAFFTFSGGEPKRR